MAVLLQLFDVVFVVDSADKRLKREDFSLDPVADMDERVFLGAGHQLQVLFEIAAGSGLQQPNVLVFTFLGLLGVLEVLVGFQERVELMVKHHLFLLHGDELFQEVLEHDKLRVLRFLLNNELVDLSCEVNYVLFAPVLLDGHAGSVDLKCFAGRGLGNVVERLLDVVACRSQEQLHLV